MLRVVSRSAEIEKFTLAELDEEEASLDRLQGWHEQILTRDLHGVVDFHLPALAVSALLADGLLSRGRLGRPGGLASVHRLRVYAAGAIAVG